MKKKVSNLIPKSFVITILAISTGLFLFGVLLFFLSANSIISVSVALTLHFMVLGLFLAWQLFLVKAKKEDKRLIYFPLLLIAVLGPFGALISAVTSTLYLFKAENAPSFAQIYEELFPREFYEEHHSLFERIRAEREDYTKKGKLVPFIEVMRHGTEKQKGEAITKILEYFKPEFSPALVMGLNDDNPVIRVRAATAVAKLEEDFLDLTMRFERALHEDPKKRELIFEYAKSLRRYAECAFVSEDTKKSIQEKALALYKKYLKDRPDDEEMRLEYARLYQEMGLPKEAFEEYKFIIADEGIGSLPVLKGYLETLFDLGKYDEIRKLAKKNYLFLDRRGLEEMHQKEILKLWRQAT